MATISQCKASSIPFLGKEPIDQSIKILYEPKVIDSDGDGRAT